jgi:HAMP domain-containing protein
MNADQRLHGRLAWIAALREPGMALAWTLPEWEHRIRLARRLRLLGRLAESLDAARIIDRVPAPAARHLVAELRYTRWRSGALVWALERVARLLADAPYPLVLLKGAAYIGQDLPIAKGRMPSDVDILVPREHIADAQSRLAAGGWSETELDAHDQRYYHEWSHEVPPMRHDLHGLELDLHHNILPPVAHTRVDAARLLAHLQPSQWPRWQVLQPVDQVLHSATHLFHDSEARDRVRDIVDIDGLLRHFGRDPAFWDALVVRADELGFQDALAVGCHFARAWLDTPVPHGAWRRIRDAGPGAVHRAWLLPLMRTLLTPTDPDARPPLRQDIAAQLLLVRYHYRRMPLRILLPHLWHKWRSQRAAEAEAADPVRN